MKRRISQKFMKKLKFNNTTWIQVFRPKTSDLQKLKKEYGFHSITVEELKKPSIREKVERYKDYIFMVIHFPIYNQKERTVQPGELDFLLTKNTLALATIRYSKIQALKEFEQNLKNNDKLKSKSFKNPVKLLYQILSANFEFSLRQLDHIKLNIDKSEKEIYRGHERRMLEEISYLTRDVVNFKRIIKFHGENLRSLEKEIVKLFGLKYRPYLESLLGQFQQVNDILEAHTETVRILHDTNQTLLSAKTNEAIKLLSIIAVFTFPLTLLATIFGWHTRILPIVGSQYDFWILIGIFGAIIFLMFLYFKRKKWL